MVAARGFLLPRSPVAGLCQSDLTVETPQGLIICWSAPVNKDEMHNSSPYTSFRLHLVLPWQQLSHWACLCCFSAACNCWQHSLEQAVPWLQMHLLAFLSLNPLPTVAFSSRSRVQMPLLCRQPQRCECAQGCPHSLPSKASPCLSLCGTWDLHIQRCTQITAGSAHPMLSLLPSQIA